MRYPSLAGESKEAILRLIRSNGVGAVQFFRLYMQHGGLNAALDANKKKLCPQDACVREMEATQKMGARLIVYGEADYPEGFLELYDAPPIITFLGNTDLLSASPMVAMVGGRNASAAGKNFARSMATKLATAGVTVVSGFARGVDTEAHEAAIQGKTLAVFGVGMDRTYPEQNHDLRQRMLAHGNGFISELPLGAGPMAHHFPARNRLIAALADAVVVLEASMQSGSLITARMALEMGKELFAVPGFPSDPRHHGCNWLIQQGAHLVQTAEDVLAALPNRPARSAGRKAASSTPVDKLAGTGKVMQALSSTPIAIDELAKACHLSMPCLMAELVELEIEGKIERLPGQKVALLS